MTKNEYLDKRNGLYNEAEALINEGKIEDADAKMAEITNLDNDFDKQAKAMASLAAMSAVPAPLANYGIGESTAPAAANDGNIYDSVEYRTAFMNYVATGDRSFVNRFTNDAPASTSDNGVVIAPTVVSRIVEKMEVIGNILPLVTRTAFPAGAVVPTKNVKPVASWVAEGAGSTKQGSALGSITINGYKLRCEVSMTLELSVKALAFFEKNFVDAVSTAMTKGLELAIVAGTGEGQPKGIATSTPLDNHTVTIAKTADVKFKDIQAAEGMVPEGYDNAVWLMSKANFDNNIAGMTDNNGQPIARVNVGLNDKLERSIHGRKVVLTNLIPANSGIIGIIFDMSDYMLNTNYAMRITSRENWDNENREVKAVLVADGKPLSLESLVVMKKATA